MTMVWTVFWMDAEQYEWVMDSVWSTAELARAREHEIVGNTYVCSSLLNGGAKEAVEA